MRGRGAGVSPYSCILTPESITPPHPSPLPLEGGEGIRARHPSPLMAHRAWRMASWLFQRCGAAHDLGELGRDLALAGTVSEKPVGWISEAWPLISLTVGWLILLLMLSLMIRGLVTTIQLIFFPEG